MIVVQNSYIFVKYCTSEMFKTSAVTSVPTKDSQDCFVMTSLAKHEKTLFRFCFL